MSLFTKRRKRMREGEPMMRVTKTERVRSLIENGVEPPRGVWRHKSYYRSVQLNADWLVQVEMP